MAYGYYNIANNNIQIMAAIAFQSRCMNIIIIITIPITIIISV